MYKQILWSLLLSGLLGIAYAFTQESSTSQYPLQEQIDTNLTQFSPTKQHINEAQEVLKLLTKAHYKQIKLDDSLSQVTFDNFIARIDGAKLYFNNHEVNILREQYAEEVDDMIADGALQPIYDLYAHFQSRALAYVSFADSIIEQDFDFNKKEYINLDFEGRNRPDNTQGLQIRWRKTIKNEVLNLKLANNPPEDIQETLRKRRKLMRTRLMQLNNDDVFEDFMSALTNAFDPHTDYFSAIRAENFNIEMKKSLEGIGARLSQDTDYTTIHGLIPGGPAFRSKQLEPTDRIVGVAQGDTGQLVDVVGWRIHDVVQLIRGDKGTIVRLLILPGKALPGGKKKEVRLRRDKINIEDAIATKKTYTITRQYQAYTLGVITLPSFYLDWEEKQKGNLNYRSSFRDVQRLIKDLEDVNVSAILIDLRKNGGGALTEAVALTGLFLRSGPIVQIQDYEHNIFVRKDKNEAIAYKGPLMVLVDRFSASASEIFSAAIQDYNRGIIAGERTHGKGTVQNILPLKETAKQTNQTRAGQLKLTFAQYYRVNGESTQKAGVTPDVQFPSQLDQLEYRAAEERAAIAWDKVSPLTGLNRGETAAVNDDIRKKLTERLANDLQHPQWRVFIEEGEEYKRKKHTIARYPLDYATRKASKENTANTSKEPVQDSLTKDNYLRESLYLLADILAMSAQK